MKRREEKVQDLEKERGEEKRKEEEKAQWQIHEEEKAAAEEEKIESLPEALDIDDLLDD